MATKLVCPRCRTDLTGSFDGVSPAVCPRCRTGVRVPRKKSTAVVRAKPFRAPPTPPAAGPSYRTSMLVTAAGVLFLAIGLAWVLRIPRVDRIAAADGAAPAPAKPAAPAKAPAEAVAPLPDLPKTIITTRPRVRHLPRDDRVPEMPAALAIAPNPRPAAAVTPNEQEKIDRAVRLGVEHLRTNKGTWLNGGSYEVGFAALPALALLEVGEPADDPLIREAAAAVRKRSAKLQATYEISLAILFLDRLGDPADAPLIRSLALRLIAGQTSLRGWDYRCPLVPTEMETPLEKMLQKLQPDGRLQVPLAREPGRGLVDLAIPLAAATPLDRALEKGSGTPAPMPAANLAKPLILDDAATTRDLVAEFPVSLRSLPIVQPQRGSAAKGKKFGDRDDNSNTQFALLALWTARRHGVPVDRSLLLADRRFAESQQPNGGWGYHVYDRLHRSSMTCVGLLGLALGHGSLLSDRDDLAARHGAVGDPAIQRGLESLGRFIGDPDRPGPQGDVSLYFLWSLERVGVMYQLPTIGGKNWYRWGANHLVASQRPNGSWNGGGYPGSATPLDTAFALLFLGRSNLVPDLTDRLRLHMAIGDPDRR